MIVTVRPVGREEYALTLSGPPSFSSETGIGYKAASIPCILNDEQRLKVLGGRLRIHGESGIVWQGIVIRRPGAGEPLEAQGWGWCGSLGRRKVMYAKTDFLSDMKDFNGQNWGRFERSIAGGVITIAQSPNTTSAANDGGGYDYRGDTLLTSLTFTAAVNTAALTLYVRGLDVNGTPQGTAYSQATPGTFTGQSITFPANTYGFRVWGQITNPASPPDSSVYVGIYSATLMGTALTAVQTRYILADVLSNEIATTYLPAGDAYRAWMAADSTAWDVCEFDSCTATAKVAEALKHSAYDFGWYQELVAGQSYCVPHWTAKETTPSLIIRAEECEGVPDIDEAALDELESVERVSYHNINGETVYTDVTDTDASHPLVALGITRYGDVTVDTSSSTTAIAIGTLALSDRGRRQVKGSLTTRVIRTNTGADVYLPDVRPGQMVRLLGLPDGYVDCRIIRATCIGDAKVMLELDNEPYRLDIALAQLRG